MEYRLKATKKSHERPKIPILDIEKKGTEGNKKKSDYNLKNAQNRIMIETRLLFIKVSDRKFSFKSFIGCNGLKKKRMYIGNKKVQDLYFTELTPYIDGRKIILKSL